MTRRNHVATTATFARSHAIKGWLPFFMLIVLHLPPAAHAHSASDAYLNLTFRQHAADGQTLVEGQWDIALRDLDFVLGLDDDGDGRLTWGEVRRHWAAIERYGYASLQFDGGSPNACTLKPGRQMIDEHADGAYAVLFFEVRCARAPKLALDYHLFFSIDPSHRGILVVRNAADIATAVLSPDNARIDLIR